MKRAPAQEAIKLEDPTSGAGSESAKLLMWRPFYAPSRPEAAPPAIESPLKIAGGVLSQPLKRPVQSP